MKVSDLLDSRRASWQELEQLCSQMEGPLRRTVPAPEVARFASLYRSACADLALADAYQFPADTIRYLHQLVGRAHNQLYRSRTFRIADWYRELLVRVPRQLFSDGCLRLAMVIFWGVFGGAMVLAARRPEFTQQIVGQRFLTEIEQMHSHSVGHRDVDANGAMAGFYIHHNASIGLRCFAFGLLLGIGGLFETVNNAAILGAIFGHMTTVSQRTDFFQFVTAHGPFELTAIVLMAAAGMRLGFSLVDTGGRGRADSLRRAARRSVPVVSAGILLFLLAALIEAFLSPTDAPYAVKAAVAIVSALMLLFYFVVLGYPGESHDAG